MKKLFPFLFFLVISIQLFAQNRFAGGVFAGVNLAQIDGDFQQGYNKTMLCGGIRAAMILTKNFDIGTELLYNGKGAASGSGNELSTTSSFNMTMHYAEAALMANVHFDQNDAGYNQKTIQVGLSYGRLLSSTNQISKFSIVDTAQSKLFLQENLKNTDVSLIVGFAYRFTPKIGVAVRHTYSLTPFFEKELPIPRSVNKRDYFIGRSYFLSFHLFYDIWTPELRRAKKVRRKK